MWWVARTVINDKPGTSYTTINSVLGDPIFQPFAADLAAVTWTLSARKKLPSTLLTKSSLSMKAQIHFRMSTSVQSPLTPMFPQRAPFAKNHLRKTFAPTILGPWGTNDGQRMEARPMSNLERIIRLKTVLARTGLSRSTMYRKIAEGTFPCQVRISVHGAGWRESAINRWIEDPIGYRNENADKLH